jgi:hypothetical protein
MPGITRAPLALATLACLTLSANVAARAAVSGYTPPAGYEAESLNLSGDTFAVAPDGRFAVANGGTITVYNQADPTGRSAIGGVTDARIGYIGALAFAGNDLLISESGAQDTVFQASLAAGTLTALAPAGSIANVANVGIRPTDGAMFALASNNPGTGAVYQLSGGQATLVASGLGTGYLGGMAFDIAGNLHIGDTNDPTFSGQAGRVLTLNPAGAVIGVDSLAGGGGNGAFDITFDNNGDLFATTGGTLTRLSNGVATPFGAFGGAFPFPTDIAADPSGGLLVNGAFTGVGGIFRVRPTAAAIPEPASVALLGFGALPLLRRRRRSPTAEISR